eukprot:2061472-Pyramimonas_sp.AAC.1
MQAHKVTKDNEPLTTEYCKTFLTNVAVDLQKSIQDDFLAMAGVRAVLLVLWCRSPEGEDVGFCVPEGHPELSGHVHGHLVVMRCCFAFAC